MVYYYYYYYYYFKRTYRDGRLHPVAHYDTPHKNNKNRTKSIWHSPFSALDAREKKKSSATHNQRSDSVVHRAIGEEKSK